MAFIAGWVVGVHLLSAHAPSEPWQDNFNPGIYARSPSGITVGIYHNSLGRTSLYGGQTFERGPFALTVGLVSGYGRKMVEVKTDSPRCGDGMLPPCWRQVGLGAITPMVAPSVAIGPVRLSYIPRLGGKADSNVFHLSLERQF